ncbi:FMN-binding protein [Tindallia californiensis]|uniref:Major membrane immunogen, membrane-anchored lipoprotein n=1 Tax=Tindallia californiensis TaxID=159292 RepID=A0A1H3MN57_9FIRM|nr:FMN-binding protein [Tindallia californiensis]SDY78131.1 Major membrane immunogen, membrane-anchored lipoprotein [Tindallia californiensis]
MKRSLLFVSIILILSLMVVGCGDSGATEEVTTEETAGEVEVLTAEETEFNERGHKAVIEITRENGEIVAVNYNEVYEDGGSKKEDEDYNANMEAGSGIAFVDAVAELEEALIAAQDPEAVDVVSGATSSHGKFVELAKEALQ